MLNSRNDKNCTSSSKTKFVADTLLEKLRDVKYNPLRTTDQWYLSIWNTRIKVGSPTIWGLNDSQLEICQYKSHGSKSQIQVGINVKIPIVTATVGLQ